MDALSLDRYTDLRLHRLRQPHLQVRVDDDVTGQSVPLLLVCFWSARICRLRPAGKRACTSTNRSSDVLPPPSFRLPKICRSALLRPVNLSLSPLSASVLTHFLVPIIQNDNRVASIAITTASRNSTVVSASTTREPPSQTLHGSHYIPTSAIDSSGVASSDTSPPSHTLSAQSSSTTKSLPVSTIFAIAIGGVVSVAAILCFAFFCCRRSSPAPPSETRARYLRKRRPPTSMPNAWTTIEPVVSPDNADGLTATLRPPRSTPAITNGLSHTRLSGFRIPRKAPPRLPSWALSPPPDIPEIRSPQPIRLIPGPILVQEIPSTPDQYPLASANLITLGVSETRRVPHQVPPRPSSQALSPSPGPAHPNLTTQRGPALSSSNSLSSWSAETLSVFPMPPRGHPSQAS